jgi:hypothetical protein
MGKDRDDRFVLVIVGLVGAIVTSSVMSSDEGKSTGISPTLPTSGGPAIHTVVYRVTGNATTVDLTYQNLDRPIFDATTYAQAAGQHVPWSTTFYATEGAVLYVSAQRKGPVGTGNLFCSIEVDGVEVVTVGVGVAYPGCAASRILVEHTAP